MIIDHLPKLTSHLYISNPTWFAPISLNESKYNFKCKNSIKNHRNVPYVNDNYINTGSIPTEWLLSLFSFTSSPPIDVLDSFIIQLDPSFSFYLVLSLFNYNSSRIYNLTGDLYSSSFQSFSCTLNDISIYKSVY